MRVLVTGSRGRVGSQVVTDFAAAGHAVVEYDLTAGRDILDQGALHGAAEGCDAIIHAAAALGHGGQSSREIMEVNLLGTWNVLSVAKAAAIHRVVYLSSVNALGVFMGERRPDYLPIDDAHPRYPSSPYGISKSLSEDMCLHVSATTDVSVICLRPPVVWTERHYARVLEKRLKRPAFEWEPRWEYGAFIDVRDLSRACSCALTCRVDRFACLLVSSADISTSGRTSRELADFLLPGLAWRGGSEYEADPFRSLVNIAPAQRILGWEPKHSWRAFVEEKGA